MNIFQAEIDRLKSGIAEALPGVIVRGSLIDHESLRTMATGAASCGC